MPSVAWHDAREVSSVEGRAATGSPLAARPFFMLIEWCRKQFAP